MTASSRQVSANQVRKAGEVVRKASRGGSDGLSALRDAVDLIDSYRNLFKRPLVTANNGLRSMVRTLKLDGQVTQRLKRMQTILDKLEREPRLSLDRMQDIGGCRVVVPSVDDVYQLVHHFKTVRPIHRESDYIAQPRSSGYRGVHLIVDYGRPPRRIEIQVRTKWMHVWATTVEDISAARGINYKMDGDAPMQCFLECYPRLLVYRERNEPVPGTLVMEYSQLMEEAFWEES